MTTPSSGPILLTGVTGLVGARLLPRLQSVGFNCRILVRDLSAAPQNAHTVTGDLLDQATLAAAVDGVETIIHLAAVFRTADEPLIWRSNLEGTRNLIAAVRAYAPGARFIMAGTSTVYSHDQARPGLEDDALNPAQAYPASKVAAEKELRESGLNWAILRFPFVYGDADGHLEALPKYAIAGGWHPATRMSTMHHRDIASAMFMALRGTFDGMTVNLADDAPLSIYELSAVVSQPLAPSAEPLLNPWAMLSDATLARRLGSVPEVRSVYQAEQQGLL